MKRSKQIDYITDKLGELRSKIEIKATLNLTDINIYAEDFYCRLFNIVYGYKLVNTNFKQANSASIDLGDSINRIAIQITSTKTPNKTKHTVQKFIEKELYKEYDRLIIFNIVRKSHHKDKKYGDINHYIDTKSDIWDYRDLIKKINSLDDENLNIVYEYFLEQFDRIHIITRRVPSDYKMRIKRFRDSYLDNSAKNVFFGGRKTEIDSLNNWLIDDNSPKNFLITSPAGRGKTALLLHWLENISLDWPICFMPISLRYETNKPIMFFESLAVQLAGVLKVTLVASEYDPVEYYKEKIAEYFELLEKSEEKVLIVIDGLDEATGWEVSENLFSNNLNVNLRIIASARILSDKDSSNWLEQLGWKDKHVQTMEVPLLNLNGVRELLINVENQPIDKSLIECYVIQLFRLTKGEPLLLNLYITDLLYSAQNGVLTSHENLATVAPGFEAYFKKWMYDQKKYNSDIPFDDDITTLLAVFSCAMAPMYITDLEDIISIIFDKPFYLEGDKLAPIQRFIIGDGVSNAYALSHPLFGIFLREEYFKNNRRIDETKNSILRWGSQTISKLDSEEVMPKDVSSYLLQFYSQHLKDNDGKLSQFEKLICNGWRKAHLASESRHLGFIRELEEVISKAKQEYDLRNLTKGDYYSIIGKCTIFSSSINGMGRNTPPKLRSYAIKHNLMTVGQSLKQIDTLQNENKPQPLIEVAKYLDAEQTLTAINMIELSPNIKNKKIQYESFLKQLNTVQYESYKSKIGEIIKELNKYKEEPCLSTSLSSLMGIDETYLVSKLDDLDVYAKKIKNEFETIDATSKAFSTCTYRINFLHDFETEKNLRSRMHLIKRVIINSNSLPPIELVNLLTIHANLVLRVTSKLNSAETYNKDEAQVALFLCTFMKLAIEEGVTTFSTHFNEYLIQASMREVHYHESGVIIDLYKIFRNILIEIGMSEEIENNILNAINKLPSGNNQTHAITNLLEFLNDEKVCKDAVNRALMASELIEDESSQISFLTSIANTTKDLDFKNSALEDAFNICCSISFIHQKLTALISIIKVRGSSLREMYIEELKSILKLNYGSDIKVQYYWQLCELIEGEVDEETYSDILKSVNDEMKSWKRLSWLYFNCIKKYLKEDDQLELFYLASKLETELEGKLYLLKDVNFKDKEKYVDSYTIEIEAKIDGSQKCGLLSLLGEITNDDNLYIKALDIANSLDIPSDKLQAYLSINRYAPKKYYHQIFENAVNLLSEFQTEKEYKKSLLLVLSLNGRTYEFMNKSIDDYAYSEGYEFKAKILGSISSSSKRPDVGDDILIDKLISTVFEVIDVEGQSRIFSNLFPIVNQQNKIKLLPILLSRHSKASRQEALAFITNNLDYLYELGGEQLLVCFRDSMKEASIWWP
ncbi:SMEK domain-containing protein [Shewanella sp.]|nr:SMEK domain-containing protein [Shewanella sp.]